MRLATIHLPDIAPEPALKEVAPDGHLELVERILHDKIAVKIVYPAHGQVDIGLRGVGKKQELCAGQGGEALQTEVFRLEHLQA